MPYGRSSSSGHGHRATHYRWSLSFDPTSPRRKRRRAASRTARKRRTQPSLPSWNWEESLATASGGRGIPNWFFGLVGSLLLLALAMHFPVLFVLGALRWAMDGADTFAENAEKCILSTMDKMTEALRISRKTSVDAPPEPEAVRAAWAAARRSLMGKLLAGTLLSNLEPVVDQSYIRDENGTIIGRRPGLKGWLRANCPDMLPHYKALMSYKALADKLRMALGVEEPDTLAGVLDFGEVAPDTVARRAGTETETAVVPKAAMTDETASKTAAADAKKRAGQMGMTLKSLQIRVEIKLLKSNVESVIYQTHVINDAMDREGGGGSMAALEAVVRGQLGFVWMRRGKRRRRPA